MKNLSTIFILFVNYWIYINFPTTLGDRPKCVSHKPYDIGYLRDVIVELSRCMHEKFELKKSTKLCQELADLRTSRGCWLHWTKLKRTDGSNEALTKQIEDKALAVVNDFGYSYSAKARALSPTDKTFLDDQIKTARNRLTVSSNVIYHDENQIIKALDKLRKSFGFWVAPVVSSLQNEKHFTNIPDQHPISELNISQDKAEYISKEESPDSIPILRGTEISNQEESVIEKKEVLITSETPLNTLPQSSPEANSGHIIETEERVVEEKVQIASDTPHSSPPQSPQHQTIDAAPIVSPSLRSVAEMPGPSECTWNFQIDKEEIFDEIIIGRNKPVIAYFHDSSDQCQTILSTLEKIVRTHEGNVLLIKVDHGKLSGLFGTYEIEKIPTILGFKSGIMVKKKTDNFGEQELDSFVDEVYAS